LISIFEIDFSFLILKRVQGFQLGSSVQPCTKGTIAINFIPMFIGIWMWSEPVRLSEDHDFETIILDTEGLNSVRKTLNIQNS